MRNVKTVAVASALLGGLATFVLGTPRPQYLERELVREIPARLPELDARPIGERSLHDLRRNHNVSAGQTEQIVYQNGNAVPAVAPAMLAEAAPQPVLTKAKAPTILGLYNKDSAVDGNKIKSDAPKTNVTKLFVNVQFVEADDNVPKGVLTLSIGKGGSVRGGRY